MNRTTRGCGSADLFPREGSGLSSTLVFYSYVCTGIRPRHSGVAAVAFICGQQLVGELYGSFARSDSAFRHRFLWTTTTLELVVLCSHRGQHLIQYISCGSQFVCGVGKFAVEPAMIQDSQPDTIGLESPGYNRCVRTLFCHFRQCGFELSDRRFKGCDRFVLLGHLHAAHCVHGLVGKALDPIAPEKGLFTVESVN